MDFYCIGYGHTLPWEFPTDTIPIFSRQWVFQFWMKQLCYKLPSDSVLGYTWILFFLSACLFSCSCLAICQIFIILCLFWQLKKWTQLDKRRKQAKTRFFSHFQIYMHGSKADSLVKIVSKLYLQVNQRRHRRGSSEARTEFTACSSVPDLSYHALN